MSYIVDAKPQVELSLIHISDKYLLVDMLSKSQDEVVQLFKRIGEKIDEFIVDENYKSIFSVSASVDISVTPAEIEKIDL